jgi:hypothetical protein
MQMLPTLLDIRKSGTRGISPFALLPRVVTMAGPEAACGMSQLSDGRTTVSKLDEMRLPTWLPSF